MKLKLFAYGLLAASASVARAGAVIDFDHDGLADPGVFMATTAVWTVNWSGNASVSNTQWGWRQSRPVIGDFTGDGRTDIAVFDRYAGTWYIRTSPAGAVSVRNFGLDDGRPVAGDFDGDGTSDLALYQWSGGNWAILRSSDQGVTQQQFGWAEGRPVPRDYDGDGRTDFAVFQRETANWYILASSAGFSSFQFGWRDVRPVPQDYDGDGKADLAVYHPATGNWYIRRSSDLVVVVQNWGWPEAQPVPDDYDGDGKADLAVYHRRTGTWFIRNSSTGQLRQFVLGGPNQAPLPAYEDGAMAGQIILAFGDSITYGTSSSANGPASGYPRLLEAVMEPLFGGHVITINQGKPGESTGSGSSRIRSVLGTYQPDLSLLMEGVNDTFGSVPNGTISSNLKSMIDACKRDGSSVILSTLTPVIKSAYRDRTAQEGRIESFNGYVPGIASSRGIAWVDSWNAIASRLNWQSTLMDQPTANHPNDAGYAVMREAWLKAILEGRLAGTYY